MHVNPQAPGISGVALETLVKEYRTVELAIKRLELRYPTAILNELIYTDKLSVDSLNDETAVTTWINSFIEVLNEKDDKGTIYSGQVVQDEDTGLFSPEIIVRRHGIDTTYAFGKIFFSSNDYNRVVALGENISDLLEEGAFIKRGERTKQVTTFIEAIDWLMHESKRGLYIQRYKGLGEMNPEQLWETTMCPDNRRMLQVTVEDAITADQLFTTLMGDQVEPRRNFIEENALRVVNLDV